MAISNSFLYVYQRVNDVWRCLGQKTLVVARLLRTQPADSTQILRNPPRCPVSQLWPRLLRTQPGCHSTQRWPLTTKIHVRQKRNTVLDFWTSTKHYKTARKNMERLLKSGLFFCFYCFPRRGMTNSLRVTTSCRSFFQTAARRWHRLEITVHLVQS
jgi:hypothetical protein